MLIIPFSRCSHAMCFTSVHSSRSCCLLFLPPLRCSWSLLRSHHHSSPCSHHDQLSIIAIFSRYFFYHAVCFTSVPFFSYLPRSFSVSSSSLRFPYHHPDHHPSFQSLLSCCVLHLGTAALLRPFLSAGWWWGWWGAVSTQCLCCCLLPFLLFDFVCATLLIFFVLCSVFCHFFC